MKKTLLLFLAVLCTFTSMGRKPFTEEKSITTLYPSDDWVVSDFIVTDPRFGARPEPGFDNRAAFQAAIDAAYEAGGGVVYVPAGNYEFRSTLKGVKTVRVRNGESEEQKSFTYNYVLTLPTGVQLRGDWADPEKNDNKVAGTILEVRVGKDAPAYDAVVKSWWNDSQAGNALRSSYTSIADRFIEMNACTGVRNLSIWYPEQDIHDVRPYPWTLFQTSGDSATIDCVTLVNPYNGIMSCPSELHYVLDDHMTALNKGIEVHVCTDIGRIENVRISPIVWAESGLPGAPTYQEVRKYTLKNGLGFQMHRSDWEYVSGLEVSGYKTGIWVGKEPGFDNAPNAQFYNINVSDCMTGFFVEDVNPYGLLISNSSFGAAAKGNAIFFSDEFDTSVQFNGVDFNGKVLSQGQGGVVSFENCTFAPVKGYPVEADGGNILLTQCRFEQSRHHVLLGKKMKSLKSINSGRRGQEIDVVDRSRSAEVSCSFDPAFHVTPISKEITTDIAVQPRPASDLIFKADLPRATGYNDDVPTVDVSSEMQSLLDQLSQRGGGTLYLPAGRYLVEHPVTVPSGVELRGSWDVQHHTMGGGTALFTRYDGGKEGEKGQSLICLEESAGLNGITVAQLNLVIDGYDTDHPRRTPFLIQGQGKNVYAINLTISVGDKGIDLASYNTSGHYINYLGGVLLRAGVWVGGGAEGGYIRNMQFNPHYSQRLPRGGQGYPNVRSTGFVQSNCSALKFADVKGQTIFNNFVFGSVYGIHFLKDSVTGRYPGKMTMVGHGSDGCTYALFVEDADKDTEIIGINSELVNTRIVVEPVRSYVLMGREAGNGKVHPEASLRLYNSAFWGSPVIGSIVNGGKVWFQQTNFTRCGNPGVDVRGGEAHVITSYFAQPMREPGHVYLHCSGKDSHIYQINNHFHSAKRIGHCD